MSFIADPGYKRTVKSELERFIIPLLEKPLTTDLSAVRHQTRGKYSSAEVGYNFFTGMFSYLYTTNVICHLPPPLENIQIVPHPIHWKTQYQWRKQSCMDSWDRSTQTEGNETNMNFTKQDPLHATKHYALFPTPVRVIHSSKLYDMQGRSHDLIIMQMWNTNPHLVIACLRTSGWNYHSSWQWYSSTCLSQACDIPTASCISW